MNECTAAVAISREGLLKYISIHRTVFKLPTLIFTVSSFLPSKEGLIKFMTNWKDVHISGCNKISAPQYLHKRFNNQTLSANIFIPMEKCWLYFAFILMNQWSSRLHNGVTEGVIRAAVIHGECFSSINRDISHSSYFLWPQPQMFHLSCSAAAYNHFSRALTFQQ